MLHIAPIDCRSAKGERCDVCGGLMPVLKEDPKPKESPETLPEVPEIGNYGHKEGS
jgi:hypothetical protein